MPLVGPPSGEDRLQPKLSRSVAACAGLVATLLWSLPGAASAAGSQTISATIPNTFARVYDCSELGTRCSLDRTYQINPPFDATAPSIYVNRYGFVEGRHCKHDCRPPRHPERDRNARRGM